MNYSEIKERIKERADLGALISRYTKPVKTSRGFKACCPLPGHKEKTPSFHYDQQKNYFYCYGCSRGGDVFKFMELVEGLPFFEALKELASEMGIDLPKPNQSKSKETTPDVSGSELSKRELGYAILERAAKFFQKILIDEVGPGAKQCLNYLKDRGIGLDEITQFRLGWSPEKTNSLVPRLKNPQDFDNAVATGLIRVSPRGPYDFFRGRLMIPILDVRGRVLGFSGRTLEEVSSTNPKYINSPESEWFKKKAVLYGIERAQSLIRSEHFVCIVEGFFDQWAMQRVGIPAIAVMGTALTPDHLAVLGRFTKNVVLVMDTDAAGVASTRKSLPLLIQNGWSARVFSDFLGKDPDEWIAGLQKLDSVTQVKDRLRTAPEGLEWLASTVLQESLKEKMSRQQIVEAMGSVWVLAKSDLEKQRLVDVMEPILGFERAAISKAFEQLPKSKDQDFGAPKISSSELTSIGGQANSFRNLQLSQKDRFAEECFMWWFWHGDLLWPQDSVQWEAYREVFNQTFLQDLVEILASNQPKDLSSAIRFLEREILGTGKLAKEIEAILPKAFVVPEKSVTDQLSLAKSSFEEFRKSLDREKIRAEIAKLRNASRSAFADPEETQKILQKVQALSLRLEGINTTR